MINRALYDFVSNFLQTFIFIFNFWNFIKREALVMLRIYNDSV